MIDRETGRETVREQQNNF